MTCLPTGPVCPPIPPCVTMGELAMAAGVAGRGLALCWQDFPAPILCDLWKQFASCAGPGRVLQVSSQADIRKLSERAMAPRLVLVHAPRLYNPTAWAMQMASPAAEVASRPAMFSRFAPTDPDEDPGTTLVLRGNSHECMAIGQWLAAGRRGIFDWAGFPPPRGVELTPSLMSLLSSHGSTNDYGLNRFRDRQVLHALLAGACLVRAARQGTRSENPLVVGPEDYELVRGLLQSPVVGSVDEAFDPLAAAMMNRANVYLAVKYGAAHDGQNPFANDGCVPDGHGDHPPRDLITRREVVDLGNVRSRLVRRLIAYLQRQPDGYRQFGGMGLARRPPEQARWARTQGDALALLLRSWTLKQVRTRFDQMRRDGLLTAEREHGNGPWRYSLPEELAGGASAFRGLPHARDLAAGAPASA